MHECLVRRLAGGGSMQCMSVLIGGWLVVAVCNA
jgi:hypothetical protein